MDFSGSKSSAPLKARLGEQVISEKENSIFAKKSEFVSSKLAAGNKPRQTFSIILPNLIHQSKKRNLPRRKP